MSHLLNSISTAEVIPSVETNLFVGHETARFAVGILAVGNNVLHGREEEFNSYLRLRARVYADQTNMLPPEQVLQDGTERDEDDIRSVHFSVVENGQENSRTIGSMRLIIKLPQDDRPLPIERFFPEAFNDGPASIGSTEVSRYICRHENLAAQGLIKWQLYSKALAYGIAHELGPVYAVVEEALEKRLTMDGVANKRIAEPKLVPEYNHDNLAIILDTNGLGHMLEERSPGLVAAMGASESSFMYMGTKPQVQRKVA